VVDGGVVREEAEPFVADDALRSGAQPFDAQ
jgi:hypothetical protein